MKLLSLVLLLSALSAVDLRAQVPPIINYQGRVAVGTTNFNGTGQFKFALVNSTGSTTFWSNDGTSTAGSQPTAAVSLTVTKGLYSVLLGDTSLTNMTAVPATVFNNSDVRLRVWFNDGTNGSQLLTPDQRLASTGYAMISGTVSDGAITSAKIASGAVGSAQIASGVAITGTLTGNASTATTATSATNATTATNFSGSLAGDVTGTQATTVVAKVGTSTAANVHAAELLANAATNLNTASAIVKRDASGNFTAGTITVAGDLFLPATSSATTGVISLGPNPTLHIFGINNIFAGAAAGNFTTTGTLNSAYGVTALNAITTGSNDTASGYQSLALTTTGSSNLGAGSFAMQHNVAGSDNTATGSGALQFNTYADENVAVGSEALQNQSFANGNVEWSTNNVAVGYRAMQSNQPTSTTTGINNTAVGTTALINNTTGSNNIAIGNNAGGNLTTGNNNIEIGSTGTGSDSGIIRIGTAQTDTFLTGFIHGNGSNLTNVPAASVTGTLTASQLASSLTLAGTTSGTFSGPLTGNVTGNVTGSAASFTGSLAGDVTGTQAATVVAKVGTSTAVNVHAAELLANAATDADTASAIVKRDASGNFTAKTVTLDGNLVFTGSSATAGVIVQAGGVPLFHTYGHFAGDHNIFAGGLAGNFTLTGIENAAFGEESLSFLTSGTANAALGSHALNGLSSGSNNTAAGYEALGATTIASNNTACGAMALMHNSTGAQNTAIGTSALLTQSFNNGGAVLNTNNTAVGYSALSNNNPTSATTGIENTALGANALTANTTGSSNTASGAEALSSNTVGLSNTASGKEALRDNTLGRSNTAAGMQAMASNTTAGSNVAIGVGALQTQDFSNAGANWISGNVAVGFEALFNNESTTTTNGYENTALGFEALFNNTTGSNNVVLGWSASSNSTSGSNNVVIGSSAGSANTTGSNNVYLANAGAVESGTIRIGTSPTHTKAFISGISGVTSSGGVAVFINSSGQLGTVTSSRRFKDHIETMDKASEVLFSLRPVSFRYKPEIDAKGVPQFGLIAEEVNEVDPDLVVRDDHGEIQTVRYEQVNAMLLNEFLKDHRRAKAKDSEIADLKRRLTELEARDKQREARLTRLEQFLPTAPQGNANTVATKGE